MPLTPTVTKCRTRWAADALRCHRWPDCDRPTEEVGPPHQLAHKPCTGRRVLPVRFEEDTDGT